MSIEVIPPVLDHEAFATKYMPDLNHDVKEFQVFHWKLSSSFQLEKELTSPEFDCGGYKWRILFFPLGNSNVPQNDNVSVYLYCTPPEGMEKGWHTCAQFALAISNPHDPTVHTVSHAHHRFTPEEPEWGFTRFSELRKLTQPQPGRNRPTVEEDSAVVSVYLRVLEDPTGVLWHNFVNYDSRKQTGYIGLKNQGSTAYMNTDLQFLFHTHYFRKAIYQIPTEDQSPTESIPLALQRVFYNLQTSDRPVETTELTKSLGWKSPDSFVAQDVQEFNRVFQGKLESLMKGTRVEGVIPKLFRGKMKSFIKCVNVEYEESKIEEFNDIQLEVKGIKTLYDSFRDYVAAKTLDGENKYHAEGLGLQDARKSIIFQSFPPVLHLQLKRWEYDEELDAMVKVNDRFEFPLEIDLDEFLDETADRSKPWKYELQSVLIHTGDLHIGHNYALIKPKGCTQWLKFDDDRVMPATDREVLEGSYGGELPTEATPQALGNQDGLVKSFASAYILAYIRKAAIDEVMAPLTEEDVPLHLKRGLDEERAQMEAKGEREEQQLLLTVKVMTDETFSRHSGVDVAVFDEKNSSPADPPTFRVPRHEIYSAFKSRVSQHFGYSESRVRLWALADRQNRTVRVDTYISESDPSLTVDVIRNTMAVRESDPIRLYLDILPDPSEKIQWEDAKMVIIFLKHFDAAKQSLSGVGKVYVPNESKVCDLVPIINERMKWAPGTLLKLYEEIKPDMIEPMKPEYTFEQSDIQDGDIVCFQVEVPSQETLNLESQGSCSNPQQFYKVLRDRVTKQ